mmetsp:Transcript_122594/g.352216  ORF Transcript_122594/g.352216 Transcript_122594/m.352216 type:complete len:95 (+) Transcript_122594:316-600(+)
MSDAKVYNTTRLESPSAEKEDSTVEVCTWVSMKESINAGATARLGSLVGTKEFPQEPFSLAKTKKVDLVWKLPRVSMGTTIWPEDIVASTIMAS